MTVWEDLATSALASSSYASVSLFTMLARPFVLHEHIASITQVEKCYNAYVVSTTLHSNYV